jgi:hypothetical protein
MAHQLAHVGERLERHDLRDDERPRQSASPIRAGRRYSFAPTQGGVKRGDVYDGATLK